jgi:RND family efflux transporter MFP subunit
MKSWLRVLVPALAIVLGLAVILLAPLAEGAETAQVVLGITVHPEPETAPYTLPGTIRARIESDLGFRVGGKVMRRLVDSGQTVTAGQVLAELDPADLDLQLRQARADLASAATARATALSEMARVATLHRGGWSTGSDYDRQKATADDAQSKFDRAQQAVTLAERARDYNTLRADADGVITATAAEPGQVVAAGQTVFRLARLDEREAAVAVPEALVDAARTGSASVTVWAVPGRVYAAKLRELSPNADAATRTYAARFSLPGADSAVLLGMTATVTIARESRLVTRVPMTAILDSGHGPTVYVVDSQTGTLALRPVTLAGFSGDQAIVTSGLQEGETIVAIGVQKLDAGEHVRVVSRIAT